VSSHDYSASTRGASDASSRDGSRGESRYGRSGKPKTMSEKLTTCVMNVRAEIAVKICMCMHACVQQIFTIMQHSEYLAKEGSRISYSFHMLQQSNH